MDRAMFLVDILRDPSSADDPLVRRRRKKTPKRKPPATSSNIAGVQPTGARTLARKVSRAARSVATKAGALGCLTAPAADGPRARYDGGGEDDDDGAEPTTWLSLSVPPESGYSWSQPSTPWFSSSSAAPMAPPPPPPLPPQPALVWPPGPGAPLDRLLSPLLPALARQDGLSREQSQPPSLTRLSCASAALSVLSVVSISAAPTPRFPPAAPPPPSLLSPTCGGGGCGTRPPSPPSPSGEPSSATSACSSSPYASTQLSHGDSDVGRAAAAAWKKKKTTGAGRGGESSRARLRRWLPRRSRKAACARAA